MPWNTKKVQKHIKQQGGFNCRDTHLHIIFIKAYKFNKDWESPTSSQNIGNFAGIVVFANNNLRLEVCTSLCSWVSAVGHTMPRWWGKDMYGIPMVRWCPEKIIPSTLSGKLHPPKSVGNPFTPFITGRQPHLAGVMISYLDLFLGGDFFIRFEPMGSPSLILHHHLGRIRLSKVRDNCQGGRMNRTIILHLHFGFRCWFEQFSLEW